MNISKLISTVIFVTAISTIYLFGMIFYLYKNTDSTTISLLKDALSTTSGFLSGIATLATAYVAANLFNDWRGEKEYDTKATYLNSAIQKLSEIHSNLIESRSNANNLLKIGNNLILKTDYINQMSISHKKTLILVYADLKVVSKLFDKQELISQYFIYEKFINVFDIFNGLLLKRYKTYFYYYIDKYSPDQKNQHINVFRLTFTHNIDGTHVINQSEISNFLKCDLGRKMGDITDECTYLDHIDECLNAHEDMVNLCIMQLKTKPKNEKAIS